MRGQLPVAHDDQAAGPDGPRLCGEQGRLAPERAVRPEQGRSGPGRGLRFAARVSWSSSPCRSRPRFEVQPAEDRLREDGRATGRREGRITRAAGGDQRSPRRLGAARWVPRRHVRPPRRAERRRGRRRRAREPVADLRRRARRAARRVTDRRPADATLLGRGDRAGVRRRMDRRRPFPLARTSRAGLEPSAGPRVPPEHHALQLEGLELQRSITPDKVVEHAIKKGGLRWRSSPARSIRVSMPPSSLSSTALVACSS